MTNGGIVAIIAMGWEITEKLSESLGGPAGDSPVGQEYQEDPPFILSMS